MRPLEDIQRDALREARAFIVMNAVDITGGPAKRVMHQIDTALPERSEVTLKWPVR